MVTYSSASDALDGAVAMQRAVDRLNRDDGSRTVSMRVGLSAGDATHEDGDWFGQPVVEAARLCAEATGAQILATDTVRVLAGTRGAHEFQTVGELTLKGLSQPVTACSIDWSPPADIDELAGRLLDEIG